MAPTLIERLRRDEIVLAPGAYDAFSARLIEHVGGFDAVFMSGAGISYTKLAESDVGLVNQSEMVEAVATLTRGTSLPVLCDGDNGYGNAMNTMRTIRMYASAGAAAIQLEDQSFPKRCGHMAGKKLISKAEAVDKMRAAVAARDACGSDMLIIARTDAATVEGLDAAIDRARAYQEAGADLLFVEAPRDEVELRHVTKELPGIPHIVNMVEGGKTPPFPAGQLQDFGYAVAIYPNTLLRCFARLGEEVLGGLKDKGGTKHLLDRMLSFDELNKMLGIDAFSELESKYVPKD